MDMNTLHTQKHVLQIILFQFKNNYGHSLVELNNHLGLSFSKESSLTSYFS